jgi:hypothetical protein
MLGIFLVAFGSSLRSVTAEDACAAVAAGYTGSGLDIDGCPDFGSLPAPAPLIKATGGDVKIWNCVFKNILSSQGEGLVIHMSDGVSHAEIKDCTFTGIQGPANYFSVWIETTTTIYNLILEDFADGVPGVHIRSGGATISRVTAIGFNVPGVSNHAYVIWVMPNGPVSYDTLYIENSIAGGLLWSEEQDVPVVPGITAVNTQFGTQVVRNSNNRVNITNAHFTNSAFLAESQSNGPILFRNCLFEGGENTLAKGLVQENGGTFFVVDCTFQNLAKGIWSELDQGGQGFEICNSQFKNVASCIEIRVDATVYISGTSFVDYTGYGVRIDTQEGGYMALSTFVVENSYFAPAPGGEGKAIEVQLTGYKGTGGQTIKSSAFKSSAVEVTVTVQAGGTTCPLVVGSDVQFLGDPGSFVRFLTGASADVTKLAPTAVSEISAPGKVGECPSALFGGLPPAPSVPPVLPDPTDSPAAEPQPEPQSPVQTESQSAVQTESHSPVQTESHSPVQTESHSPLQTESHSPAQTESHSPVQTESQSAVQTEAQSAVQTQPQSAGQTQPQSAVQTVAQSAVETPKQSPAETAPQSAGITPGGGVGNDNSQNNNNADSGSPLGAAIGGAVAGVAAVVAGLIAFFVIKKRRENRLDEGADEDADVGDPTELISTADLGEDHVFVSEYGLSDNRSPDEGGVEDEDSAGDDQE